MKVKIIGAILLSLFSMSAMAESNESYSLDDIITIYQLQDYIDLEGEQEALKLLYDVLIDEECYEEARMVLRVASNEGYGWASLYLGKMYLNGYAGLKKTDVDESIKWFEKSDLPEAKRCLGEAYMKKSKYEMVLYYYAQAAKNGDELAQESLYDLYSTFYYYSIGDEYSINLLLYDPPISVSRAEAMYLVGMCHYNGYSVEENYVEAAKWYEKAAEAGHQDAQGQIGNCYMFGRGVAQDLEKGLYWWQRCADQGNGEAQSEINKMFRNLSKDASRSPLYKYGLGICYYYGYGTKVDKSKAFSLIQEAAWLCEDDADIFLHRNADELKRGGYERKCPASYIQADDSFSFTRTGLKYKMIRKGSGAMPSATDVVTVHYIGKLLDGTVFDSSYERGEPMTFSLDNVIEGWKEGLQLMKEGSKYQFIIPSPLAYGRRGTPGGPIGAETTLFFEIELIGISK